MGFPSFSSHQSYQDGLLKARPWVPVTSVPNAVVSWDLHFLVSRRQHFSELGTRLRTIDVGQKEQDRHCKEWGSIYKDRKEQPVNRCLEKREQENSWVALDKEVPSQEVWTWSWTRGTAKGASCGGKKANRLGVEHSPSGG